MRRSPCIAATAMALTAATPVVGLIAAPAAAQGWRGGDRDIGDGELRELLREVLMDRGMERRQGRRQERREGARRPPRRSTRHVAGPSRRGRRRPARAPAGASPDVARPGRRRRRRRALAPAAAHRRAPRRRLLLPHSELAGRGRGPARYGAPPPVPGLGPSNSPREMEKR